jgi:outer membrane protein assembly factor BamD
VARAKLSLGDSWYAEGGSATMAQAESEYKDFIVYFPTMPEAAEAQMKIGNIHYAQMEKPDRDFTHAKRAEDEYRQMILQFPDSKLVPEAKARLREVQEVLAEREFRVSRYYYMRDSWAAAMARLKSLIDAYPLYSGADEALFMLGDAYERQIQAIRQDVASVWTHVPEDAKNRLIKDNENEAAEAYSRLITRYPVTQRAAEAKQRLEAMHRPVPTPTPEAIAQNKAEEESRRTPGMFERARGTFRKSPDISLAAKTGEPTLVDPKQIDATALVQHSTDVLAGKEGTRSVSVETVKGGVPPAGDAVPRSDTPASDSNGIPELKPNVSENSDAPAPAPAQINQAQSSSSDSNATAESSSSAVSQNSGESSSSRAKNKKKGVRKVLPF